MQTSDINKPLSAVLNKDAARQAANIMNAAMKAVDPEKAVAQHLRLEKSELIINDTCCDLKRFDNVYIIGFGKASLPMARGVGGILGDWIKGGVLITKHQERDNVGGLPNNISVYQGDHPVPGSGSLEGTIALTSLLESSAENDLVICMVSGGGSALLTLPVEGVTLNDLQGLTRLLLASGADIGEMNTIRKHLDRVKGGGLAKLAQPSALVTLILSDVVGSPLDVIASGPTVPDTTTYQDALDIIERYDLRARTPSSILSALNAGIRGDTPETPKKGDPCFERTTNVLVADNYIAAAAAVEAAQKEGFNSMLLTTFLEGEARFAGKMLAGILRQIAVTGQPLPRPACLVAGGETTVTLVGDGLGGRNLEAALGAVAALAGVQDVALITLATDGDDGPTGAAGAVTTGDTLAKAIAAGLDPDEYLSRSDSYHFFDTLGGLLEPGPSGTNVNDLTFLIAF